MLLFVHVQRVEVAFGPLRVAGDEAHGGVAPGGRFGTTRGRSLAQSIRAQLAHYDSVDR